MDRQFPLTFPRRWAFRAAMLAGASVLALAAGRAGAAPIYDCDGDGTPDAGATSCTLAQLFARPGGNTPSIRVDDKIFDNWVAAQSDLAGGFRFSSAFASGGAVAPPEADAADVRVSGVEGVNPGVRYTPDPTSTTWSLDTILPVPVGGNFSQQFQISRFGYTARIDPALASSLRIHDYEVELFPGALVIDPFTGSGSVGIFGEGPVFAGAVDPNNLPFPAPGLGFSTVSSFLGNLDGVLTSTGTPFNNLVFDPQLAVTVITELGVAASAVNNSQTVSASVAFGAMEHRFSQIQIIPEPATLALFAFGLAGLGFMRRRREPDT